MNGQLEYYQKGLGSSIVTKVGRKRKQADVSTSVVVAEGGGMGEEAASTIVTEVGRKRKKTEASTSAIDHSGDVIPKKTRGGRGY